MIELIKLLNLLSKRLNTSLIDTNEQIKETKKEIMERSKKINSTSEFQEIIKSLNLICEYKAQEIHGSVMVVESWKNPDFPIFNLTRVYDYDSPLFFGIPKENRISLYEDILNQEVELENYERAAYLRDKIISLKKDSY